MKSASVIRMPCAVRSCAHSGSSACTSIVVIQRSTLSSQLIKRLKQMIERCDAQYNHQVASHCAIAQPEGGMHHQRVLDLLLADSQRAQQLAQLIQVQPRHREGDA